MVKLGILALFFGALIGCAATGENLRSNVYTAAQVNSAQEAKAIEIISVLPAQIEIDNSKQKQQAQVGGAMLGALGGGLGGGLGGLSSLGTAGTTVGGAVVGGAAGSLVPDKRLVEGVTIAFSEGGRIFTSTQVGRQCEFHVGTAVVVSTTQNETRIQPNATCPVEKK